MDYRLMHKDVDVADTEIEYGVVKSVSKIISLDHMPLGTTTRGAADRLKMDRWWKHRGIPASRMGLNEALEALGMSDSAELMMRSMALSLSDHYWVRPAMEDIRWSDVNFFDNAFSEDVGDLLFGNRSDADSMSLNSPDNSSDGVLKKRWKVIGSDRCLVKGSCGPFKQEPFNEVIATILARCMGMDHIAYSVKWVGEEPYSVCKDFVTKETELVNARAVMSSETKRGDESRYELYVRVCREHNIDIVPFLDRMFVFDYILANADRHTGNFGIVRDPDTLEWMGPAPIYDTGSSLGYNSITKDIMNIGYDCKPFRKTFKEQLALVSSLDWFDGDAVMRCIPDIADVLDSSRGRIDPERRDAILGLIRSRTENITLMKERMFPSGDRGRSSRVRVRQG